ncbi:hypothetical protein M440DRAFT_1400906 [Trichoderma longibrachiatum ATCC 18648]|uniref:DNA ligase D 3'-phosphoesterase domain-containing protein n=1 Tax=Trichoderma longibrachiatum ATCC 18648 TaxID=983965 RepID=A0A2T4C8T9_TRILO|nr:hypothetical protein M440DRAFT_1400906 [Trichoderma longibrachiatum ATCC 18648]
MESQPRKRPLTPDLIPNPLIKKRNLDWSLDSPASRLPPPRPISPPHPTTDKPPAPSSTSTAQIEAGAVQISDHLARFTSSLSTHLRPTSADVPRLPIARYARLYESCAGSPGGAHFVVHQHDHPVAGTHYDLRLQINETSSVSWAVMYGLPGDANSSRLSRNATETRIHCLWNHLVETASPDTGSLIIWDTGTYSVLPRRSKHVPPDDPSSPPAEASPPSSPQQQQSHPHPLHPVHPQETAQSLLHAAFQTRKIRLRLHGAKLPDPYVINLRLTKSEDAAGRSRGLRTRAVGTRRRRGRTARVRPREPETSSDSSSSSDEDDNNGQKRDDDLDLIEGENIQEPSRHPANQGAPSVSEEHLEQQDAQVRLTNAYHGASNTIGSVYQRKWYLSLDRRASGFTEKRRHGSRSLWEPPPPPAAAAAASSPSSTPPTTDDGPSSGSEPESCRLSYPFYVRGPQFERSVVTGRLAEDVLRDEGVTGFVPRKGWMPVLE